MKREMDKALTSLDMITCESFLAFVGRLNFAASARTLKGINKDSQDGGVGDQRRTIRTQKYVELGEYVRMGDHQTISKMARYADELKIESVTECFLRSHLWSLPPVLCKRPTETKRASAAPGVTNDGW
jgi:hypothetical protein